MTPDKIWSCQATYHRRAFTDKTPAFLEISLAAAGRNAWVGCHPRHQNFEIARREAQIEIKLAKIIVIVRIDSSIAGIKCLDDARSYRSAVRDCFKVITSIQSYLRLIFGKNCRRLVGRSVIDDDPFCGPNRLIDHRVRVCAGCISLRHDTAKSEHILEPAVTLSLVADLGVIVKFSTRIFP